VSGGVRSRLVTPKAAALVPIPMVIEIGCLIVDHECHEPTWPLVYRQALATLDQAVGHGCRCDGFALHDTRLCAVCAARLCIGVGSHVATVVIAIVVGLDRRSVPESRVELAHLILALLAILVFGRGAQGIFGRPWFWVEIARWFVEVIL